MEKSLFLAGHQSIFSWSKTALKRSLGGISNGIRRVIHWQIEKPPVETEIFRATALATGDDFFQKKPWDNGDIMVKARKKNIKSH